MTTLTQARRRLDALLQRKGGPAKIHTIEIYSVDSDGNNQQLIEIMNISNGKIVTTSTEDSP